QAIEDGYPIQRGRIFQLQTNIGRQVFLGLLGVRHQQLEGIFIEFLKNLFRGDVIREQLREQGRIVLEELQANLVGVQGGPHSLQRFSGRKLVHLGAVQLIKVLDQGRTQHALYLVNRSHQKGIERGEKTTSARHQGYQQALRPQLAEELQQVDFIGRGGGKNLLLAQINCSHWHIPSIA